MGTSATRIIEMRDGRGWKEVSRTTEPAAVYAMFGCDLWNHYCSPASYIQKVKNMLPYDGTKHVTITYHNGTRSRYIIPQGFDWHTH